MSPRGIHKFVLPSSMRRTCPGQSLMATFWSSETGIRQLLVGTVLSGAVMVILVSYNTIFCSVLLSNFGPPTCRSSLGKMAARLKFKKPCRLKARRENCWQPDTHTLRTFRKSFWTLKSLRWMALLIPKLMILMFPMWLSHMRSCFFGLKAKGM